MSARIHRGKANVRRDAPFVVTAQKQPAGAGCVSRLGQWNRGTNA